MGSTTTCKQARPQGRTMEKHTVTVCQSDAHRGQTGASHDSDQAEIHASEEDVTDDEARKPCTSFRTACSVLEQDS